MLVALAALLLPLATAVPCVQFDTAWNLYAFGGSSDVNLGGSSSWGSPTPQTLTTTGRPPWTGNNTQCLLSQSSNAMYVLGGDSSDLSKIYIYSFGSSSWSTQSTSSVPSTLGNSRSSAILDHDTNTIFTISGDSSYQLDMSNVQATATSSALQWQAVESPSFSTSGYTVTAAQSSNHILYFGVPGTSAGSANIFVIHYAYFQPTAQAFPTVNGGASFPDSAGQAVSIPNSADNVPAQLIFVPNDFSQTYVVSHWTNPSAYNDTSGAPYATSLINSTQLLPAPSSKDSQSAYAASPNALAQIETNGNIYYISNAVGNDGTVTSGTSWTKMSYTLAGLSGGGPSGSNSTSASASASGSASASASKTSGGSSASGSASGTGSASGSASAAATSKAAAGQNFVVGGKEVVGVLAGLVAMFGALL